ncbi:hypothetical protein RirG_197850 [Rhizophagus irregularis DAOM 197198w]|uniref:Uncharacterized protein n=1 Tax=Rhizophagus irregularis (strain DAOM 197198w) TaxID=1432141 RepID=A0A015KFQ2_RHIIW|nr:hypothetical protein RirG_197850 [Rhizophagus irregularis DAOM 197198w]
MSYYSECVYKCERCGNYAPSGWCKSCQINDLEKNSTIRMSGNEQIDNFIQKAQLEINNYNNIVEWIPYDQFNNIKELGKDELTTIYSAIWKNGPLQYDYNKCEYSRQQNNKVNLKSYNSKYYTYEFLSQVYVAYSTGNVREFGPNIYGISQNPHAESYIIVFPNGYHCDKCGKKFTVEKWCRSCQISDLEKKFTNWTSGNEKIDNLIQERQLRINFYTDFIVEWIPYDQFKNIEKVNFTDGIYSTIWKDGPLYYDNSKCSYLRKQNKTVNLKYLHNSQNIIDEFLNEIKTYSISKSFCGMSQKLDTKDYILVFLQNETCDKCGRQFTYENTKYCKPCQIDDSGKISTNRISGNKEIDNLIQEMQLNINNHGTVVEWIPYTQFNIIKELGKDKLITI